MVACRKEKEPGFGPVPSCTIADLGQMAMKHFGTKGIAVKGPMSGPVFGRRDWRSI